MKERPIPFSGPMVQAILDGRKTQTRRVLKDQPPDRDGQWAWIASSTDRSEQGKFRYSWLDPNGSSFTIRGRESGVSFRCPYGSIGDLLWVRETFSLELGQALYPRQEIAYKASWCNGDVTGWRSSRYMPRRASRITLEITGVKVERLHAISKADAIAEGIEDVDPRTADKFAIPGVLYRFQHLWESINGPDSWAANPWVWAIEFKRCHDE